MQDLLFSLVKIAAILAYIYGLLWVLGKRQWWIKLLGLVVAYGMIELALTFGVLSSFDRGLLFQAASITMVSLGLNLIYGFNGQFSLGQYGFYGIGAYAAADITYRWTTKDASGLVVMLFGVILSWLAIGGIKVLLTKVRGMPVLSAFTLYLIGISAAWALAVGISHFITPLLTPLTGPSGNVTNLAESFPIHIIFFLSVILAGAFAAEVAFLFGLPVLTLGSDYFGIATLGFTIVINTLMVNSDTILPFPEMRGGRGMLGIPQVTNWFWAFFFMLIVIVIMRNLVHSSTGRAVMSVREDETAAKSMGIDIANTKLLAFVVGSLFAGIAGGVYAHYIGFLSPATFDFLLGFNPLIIVVFGGLGSMTGTIAASFGWMFFLEGLLRNLLGTMGTEAPTWRYVLYPIALLLVMLIRPQGLLGTVEWGFLKSKTPQPPKSKTSEPASVPAEV